MISIKRFNRLLFFIIGIVLVPFIHASGAFIFRNNDAAAVELQKISWKHCSDDVFYRRELVLGPSKSHEISWKVSPFGWEGPFHDPINCELTRLKFTKMRNGIRYPFEYSFDPSQKVPTSDGAIVCEFNSEKQPEVLECWKEIKGRMVGNKFSGIWDPSW